MKLNFCESYYIHANVVTHIEIKDGGHSHRGLYKIGISDPSGMTIEGRPIRCRLLKFCDNCFIPAGIINIFLKSKMAAAAILDFIKFAYLTKGIDPSCHQVYAVKIW